MEQKQENIEGICPTEPEKDAKGDLTWNSQESQNENSSEHAIFMS